MKLDKEQATFIMDFIAFQDARGKTVDITRFINSRDFDKETITALLLASKFMKMFKDNPEYIELLKKIDSPDILNISMNECFVERREYGDPCHPSIRYVCRNSKNCKRTDCYAHRS